MPSYSQTPNEGAKLSEKINKASTKSLADKVKISDALSKSAVNARTNNEIVNVVESVSATPTYATGTVKMIYGGYRFLPVPLITYSVERIKDTADNKLFDRVTIGCNGALVILPGTDFNFGKLDTEQFKQLVSALSVDRQRLTITHESGYFVKDVFPVIEGFSTEEDTWTNKIRYSFSFVYEQAATNTAAPVESYSDTWDWSESEDNVVEVTHNVSARGLNTSDNTSNNRLENAKTFVAERLGTANIPASFPPQITAIFGDIHNVTYIRRLYTESIDKQEGSYSVTETFRLVSGRNATYIHNRTFEYSIDQEGLSSVTVTGSILGQGNTAAARTANSLSAWDAIQNTLYTDSADVYDELGGESTLNTNLLSKSVTKNQQAGTIDYSVTFGDKIDDPNATNILDSSFTISTKNPTAQFASIGIPGKADGPVWQDLGTLNEGTYNITGRIVGKSIDDAINYAQHLIATYTGDTVGSRSRITDHNFDKDILTNTLSFSITWTFLGTEATGLLS